MTVLERLDRAAGPATCQYLSTFGEYLVGSAVFNIGGPKVRVASLALGGLSMLASNYLCPEKEIGDNPWLKPNPDDCMEVDGDATLYVDGGAGWVKAEVVSGYRQVQKIIKYGNEFPGGTQPTGRLYYKLVDGTELVHPYTFYPEPDTVKWKLEPNAGSSCIDGPEDAPLPPVPDVPYEWTDVETNCTYNVQPLGFADNSPDGGNPGIVFLIEAASGSRASGGRIGGCNFEPVIYYGGGGGGGNGPYTVPYGDGPGGGGGGGGGGGDDGIPWWAKALAAGAAGAIVNQILQSLIPPGDVPMWEDKEYYIQGVCEAVGEGEAQPIRTTPVAGGVFAYTVLSRLDAMQDLIQFNLDFKTPICSPSKPLLEGDWRTISFISDETSPYGRNRLRKRFRYRSVSGLGLGEVINHWRDFTWQAGPVCVQHSGASWGTPQVWASTVDEGKRVILHAAREAGIDADKVGRWTISGSSGSRYGVSGTMRVRRKGGYYWITARDGSEGPPLVAQT